MLAILLAFDHRPSLAAMMVILGMFIDGIDGRVARALGVQSEFGKQLDSLSDVVSFGVAPAFIMYVVALQDLGPVGWLVTAFFPICGALRLARFNVASCSSEYFIGLPIPVAGAVIATLALFSQQLSFVFLTLSMLVLSFLMISFVKYPNFKKRFSKTMLISLLFFVFVFVGLLIFKQAYIGTFLKWILVLLIVYIIFGLKKNVDLMFRLFLRKNRKSSNQTSDETAEI